MFEQIDLPLEYSGDGRDMLLCGDASKPLAALEPFQGRVQCVYMDPPFMTGGNFTRRRRFGASGWRSGRPAPEYPAYEDDFASREDYLTMLRGLVEQAHGLLQDTGVLCLHLDWRAAAYARVICDDVFGEDKFLNEIIWSYESGGRARRYFSRKHDTILIYAKTKKYRFDLYRVPLPRTEHRRNHMRREVDEEGRAYSSIKSGGKVYRYYDDAPVYPGDVWTDISHLQQKDPERTGYATQKPVKLLDRLLRPVVEPGDLVCDLCCGSGTSLVAAQALGCRVLGVDVSPEALMTARSRINRDNLMVSCPCAPEAALMEGELQAETGWLLLTGFHATHPCFPESVFAMDVLEAWSAGRLMDGKLHIQQSFLRSAVLPELPLFCILLPGEGDVGVSTVDASGRRRVYRWVSEG